MTRTWLIKIADAVESWPPPGMDDPGVAMDHDHAAGAMIYSARDPRRRRTGGCPSGTPNDSYGGLAAAAGQIRNAAERLR